MFTLKIVSLQDSNPIENQEKRCKKKSTIIFIDSRQRETRPDDREKRNKEKKEGKTTQKKNDRQG
jgi:hypothetical protein